MLPTVAGAYAGMQLNFIALFKAAPILTPLGMFALMLGSLFVDTRLRNSSWGVLALFAFTFISGLMLTPILTVAAGFRNGGQLVALSGGLTAAVFFALAAYATVTKRDFSFMGKILFIGVILLIVAPIANLFFQVPARALTSPAVAVLLFSMYLLHVLSNIVRGGSKGIGQETERPDRLAEAKQAASPKLPKNPGKRTSQKTNFTRDQIAKMSMADWEQTRSRD